MNSFQGAMVNDSDSLRETNFNAEVSNPSARRVPQIFRASKAIATYDAISPLG